VADVPSQLATALQDRYRIERELGAGGMATVYLARDVKHEREVAIKVLREDLSASLGAGRFLREIKIAAQLQHPHILPLLDSGEAAGRLYFVMPYVKGQSLRERLARDGELPVHDAVRLISEVVDALVEAHEHGVVHRDIKPDNVMLSGRHALVTDFGVAKAISEATGRNTITTLGVAVGTPTYMSPEQAAADPHVDHRSDIYSTGVMLYEMLTGRAPFVGATPQQALAAHVTEEPDPVSKRRPAIAPALEQVVMRCLAKRPADRFQTATELHAALEPLVTPSVGVTPTETRPITAVIAPAPSRWLRVGLIGIAGVIVLVGAYLLLSRPPATATLLQAVQLTRSAGVQEAPRITSDGKGVAYRILTPGDTTPHVELRRGGDGSAVTVATNAYPLQWSRDGDRLLVATARGLESVPALGGASTLIVARAIGGAWAPDEKRLAYVSHDSIFVHGAQDATTLLARSLGAHSLAWSPDGKWLAWVSGNPQYLDSWNLATSALCLVSAAGGTPIQLTAGTAMDMSPAWAPDSRRLLFVSSQGGNRDIYQLNLRSDGRPTGEPIRITTGLNASLISLSADGTQLAYSVATNRSSVWSVPVPAGGAVSSRSATRVTTDLESVENVNVSSDGKWLVFDSDRSGTSQIFRRLLAGGEVQQITHGTSPAFSATSSPDGKTIAYHSFVNGQRRIFTTASEGGQDQPVQVSPGALKVEMNPFWSPDGTRIAWEDQSKTPMEAWVAARTAQGWSAPAQVTPGPGIAVSSSWVDNNSLIATDLVNKRLLLVRADNGGEGPHVVAAVASTSQPMLSGDGRTIFFLQQDRRRLWAVPVTGGVPREVLRFDDPLHPHATNVWGLSEHGGTLYFTLQDPQSNIWVAPVKGLKQ
jgi:eukaryotic-like serine/threonine-protein kinase